MRILHVIPQFPYFGGMTITGGYAACLLNLSLVQADAGDDVTILSYLHKRRGDIQITPGLRVHSLFDNARPGTATYGLKLRRAASRWARDKNNQFDILHCHSGFADYLYVSAKLKKSLGIPALHTLYCPIPRKGGRWRLPVVHGLIKHCAHSMDGLSAMSENVASSMRDYGIISDIRIIGPPVSTDRFFPEDTPSSLRKDLGLATDDLVILFVGNAKPQKNLHGTLEAFALARKRHHKVKLIVTTELERSSSVEDLAKFKQQMIDLELESDIIHLGIIDNMPELMRSCDILVAPFLNSFGPSDYFMAVMEAMASGKPTIVSAVGGMPEVIKSDLGRLVDPTNPIEIAKALDWYLSDAQRRETAGANARSYVENRFAPGSIAEQYREFYAGVAS
jgi:glycosyltransferase involved in cell wall biosynthesis